MSKQVLAAVGLTAALAGIVGGVAYAQSAPVTHEAPMVVVPAAQVVTPSPAASATAIPTTTAPAPAPVATTAAPKVVAPKVVAPAPVESAAPAPAPVKQTVKRYAVSAQPETTPEPTPTRERVVIAPDDPIRNTPPAPKPAHLPPPPPPPNEG